jgi:hypothetical protein
MDRVPRTVAMLERRGMSLAQALRAVMLDPSLSHQERGGAATLLTLSGDPLVPQALLDLFFEQSGKDEIYQTALTLVVCNDRRAVPSLIRALHEDANPHRRHAAARATARALARCLSDPAQPHPVREEAAESLAYAGNREVMDALILALHDPDVRIRFWAVFGLGFSCRRDPRAVPARLFFGFPRVLRGAEDRIDKPTSRTHKLCQNA